MNKNKLGLPLQYSDLSEYYDILSQGNDDSKNRVIEKILNEQNVKTILDLTCGTGSQVFWLTKRGYKVTGSDFSPALLKIARDKAHKEKLDISLIEGDMRTINVGHFDAAITMFNAVGHLTKTDFEKTIKTLLRLIIQKYPLCAVCIFYNNRLIKSSTHTLICYFNAGINNIITIVSFTCYMRN